MVRITKHEAELMRKMVPTAHIAIVNRQSSHKGYYLEENMKTMAALKGIRSTIVSEFHGPAEQPKTKRQRKRKRSRRPTTLDDLPGGC